MTEPAVLLEAALAYAHREWAVFPVHTMRGDRCSCGARDCSSPGKHPHTKQGLKEATIDETQIREWWARWRDANIGVATGEVSGLVVVDVDGATGETTLEELENEYGELPDTTRAITGGDGLHYLFAHPGERIRNTAGKKLGAGLDVRGDGGYIVVAPSVHKSGQCYEWLDGRQPAPMPEWLLDKLREPAPRPPATPAPRTGPLPSDGGTPFGLSGLRGEIDELRSSGEGTRNNQLFVATAALAELVAGSELEEGVALNELRSAASAIGLSEVEIERTIKSGWEKGIQNPRSGTARLADTPRARKHLALVSGGEGDPTPPAPADTDDDPGRDDHLTDLGNARRLVAAHGEDFRYVPQWKTWITWTGSRWRRDVTGEIQRRAKRVAESIFAEAVQKADSEERKKYIAWAFKSESDARLAAMVSVAETEPSMPVEPHELDADPWLLVVANGTIDLHTGKLRPHRREDLCTKKVPVNYDPDAHLDMWDPFLETATDGDEELMDFLQRAVGYSLTGRTDEEVLFFVHGPAAAGKSTFMDAIQMTLGDYAATADFQTFLEQKGGGGNARSDVARLAGARFVKSVEVSEGQKLAEGLVKNLTGGDVITARFLYQNEFEFKPAFKLWLAANTAPRIDHEDEAIWRRILRVPFEHAIPKDQRDPNVKATLTDPERAGPAVLAWAVRGCLEWQQRRLGIPRTVREATDALRADQDPLHDFIEDRCVIGPDHWVPSGYLWDAYKAWAKESNLPSRWQLTQKGFSTRISNRGCKSQRTRVDGKVQRHWRGIGLQDGAADNESASNARALPNERDESEEAGARSARGPDDVSDEALFDDRALRAPRDTTFEEFPHESDHSENSPEQPSRTSRSARDDAADNDGITCARCGSEDRVLRSFDDEPLCKACRVAEGERLLQEDS